MPPAPRITLLARVALPPETVFELWTQPMRIRNWWGGVTGRVVNAHMDLRPKGLFWVAVALADGRAYDNYGMFTDVIRGEVIAADWEHGGRPVSKLVVQLLKLGALTEVTLTHREFADAATRDFHLERWTDAMEAFKAYAATLDLNGDPTITP